MRWFNIQPKRSEIEQNALNTALSIYNSDPEKYKNTMFCPYCGQPLVKSGEMRKLETLSEHVSLCEPTYKEVYVCPSKYHPGYPGCKFGALNVWNGSAFGENGGSYVSKFWRKMAEAEDSGDTSAKEFFDEYHKVGDLCALNTSEKSAEKAIYKEGLPRQIRLWSWLTLNIIQLIIEFDYSADNFGRVTSTWVDLNYLKKDNRGEFCLLGLNPIRTWKFLYNKFKRNVRFARKQDNPERRLELLLKAYAKSSNDAWIYRFFHWCMVKLHPYESKEVLKHFHISEFLSEWETTKMLRDRF